MSRKKQKILNEWNEWDRERKLHGYISRLFKGGESMETLAFVFEIDLKEAENIIRQEMRGIKS